MKRLIVFPATISLLILFLCGVSHANPHEDIDRLLTERKFDEAEKLAKEYVKKNPRDTESLCALACVYRNQSYESIINFNSSAAGLRDGESGMATVDAKDIEKIFTSQSTYQRPLFTKAEKLYYEIIGIDKEYRNAYFNLTNSYPVMGEFDNYFKVVDLFIKNLKGQENTEKSLLSMAHSLIEKEHYQESVRLFNIIQRHYPDFLPARSDLGIVYIKMHDYPRAYNIFNQVKKRDPSDYININNLAHTGEILEKFTEAYEARKVLTKGQADMPRHGYLAGLLGYLTGREYAPFLNAYIETRKKDTKELDKDFWVFSAKTVLDMKKLTKDDTLNRLESMIEQLYTNKFINETIIFSHIVLKTEKRPYPVLMLAATYDRLNHPEKAIFYLHEVKKWKSQKPDIMSDYHLNYNFGRNHFVAGNYAKTKEYLSKCYSENRENVFVNYLLGMSYYKSNDRNKAREYFTINSKLNDRDNMEYINRSIRMLEYMKINK